MQRVAIGLEYDGHLYKGWQRQEGHKTIQKSLEDALSKLANSPITTICAGRTDAGVHATGQVVHFDANVSRAIRSWVFGGNKYLPQNIRILWAKEVEQAFDARKSALFRRYCYVIYNHRIRPSLFRHNVGWYYLSHLNAKLMHEAAQYWIGENDFSSFRDAHCQSISTYRFVKSINVFRNGDVVIFDIIANAYLHHMIRNMVGVLLEIGSEKKLPIWAQEVLMAKDRKAAGITAPSSGLYFIGVKYPEEFALHTINNVPLFLNNIGVVD